MSDSDLAARRPLASRSARWAGMLSEWLATNGVRPNAISFFGVVVAGAGAAMVLAAGHGYVAGWIGWTFLALAVQVRLLCNLMDGMVAVEGGFRTPTGELWNEVPDRLADSLFLASAGIACGSPTLGWAASVLAVCSAYLRVLGASLTGGEHDFGGPMAKQQRMALLTVAALGTAMWRVEVIQWGLGILVLGTVLTCWWRVRRLARKLNSGRSETKG